MAERGYCQCGCGEKTPIAARNRHGRGQVKGEPVKYVQGHNNRKYGVGFETVDTGFRTPCKLWRGCRDAKGYGVVMRDGAAQKVHRIAYEEAYGPVPSRVDVHHKCRQPRCVEPTHLEALGHVDHIRLTWKEDRRGAG